MSNIYDDVEELQAQMAAAQAALATLQTAMTAAQGSIAEIEDATADSGWQDLTLENGWHQNDYTTDKPQYRKIGDTVKLRGLVTANGTAGIVIGTLPTGFRPQVNFFTRSVASLNQTDQVNIEVKPDGKVQDYSKAAGQTRTFICLNGVEFTIS